MKEFVILNIENTDFNTNVSRAAERQKFKMVQVEVARASDFGKNDITFIVNTHLGEVINYNDTVLGYDLEAMNISSLEDAENSSKQIPPIVIVRKTFPKYRKKQKHRLWKLKHLPKEEEDGNIHKKQKNEHTKNQRDYNMFL